MVGMPLSVLRSLPAQLAPQLCTLVASPPDGDDWLHEIKYDRWRLLARKQGSRVRLFTRGGHEWSRRLPRLTGAIAELRTRNAWLDGELVYLAPDGFPDFDRLAGCVRLSDESRLFYQLWDLPAFARTPLIERKERLASLLDDASPKLRLTTHVTGQAKDFFARANALDLEGIVSKRIDARYYAGERTRHWLKTKCWRTHRMYVGGIEFDDDDGVAALLVGTRTPAGLHYEGRVEFALFRVSAVWRDARPISESPFTDSPSSKRRVWLEPRHAIELRAVPRRTRGLLRHATASRVACDVSKMSSNVSVTATPTSAA